jgi:hypothetical protein
MTQTLYAHTNKKNSKKKEVRCSQVQVAQTYLKKINFLGSSW